jgi:hypothetical protein
MRGGVVGGGVGLGKRESQASLVLSWHIMGFLWLLLCTLQNWWSPGAWPNGAVM